MAEHQRGGVPVAAAVEGRGAGGAAAITAVIPTVGGGGAAGAVAAEGAVAKRPGLALRACGAGIARMCERGYREEGEGDEEEESYEEEEETEEDEEEEEEADK